jgi:N-glycosylase/DNA lyase
MKRLVSLIVGGRMVQREMPNSEAELLPGVFWGDPWILFTPAYWLAQAWMTEQDRSNETKYRAKDSVVDELGFCMLGGFGITAELATSAFERCKEEGLFSRLETRTETWIEALSAPLTVGDKLVRYRYPNQKARFLAAAMSYVERNPLRLDSGRSLRDQLLVIPGVGYKTASWVARNVLDSDDVAILDIHLIRAGRLCGLFAAGDDVQRQYLPMEERFLAFSRALQLRPAMLDCLIWDEMRCAGALPISMLEEAGGAANIGSTNRAKKTQLQFAL